MEKYASEFRVVLRIAIIVCVVICAWILISAVIVSQETGILSVRSDDPKAALIISQSGKQSVAVGVGSAKVRLKAGSYQILASDNGKQSTAAAQVYKKRTSTSQLPALQLLRIPSASTINFKGMSALINIGLSTTQINTLQEDLFRYKPRAQVVSVNTGSVQSLPRTSSNNNFTAEFKVSIDSTTYKARISYVGFDDIQLQLYNQSGQLVFDSSSASQTGE